jgi:RNA polymerase sigma factor (sigma-70 family)
MLGDAGEAEDAVQHTFAAGWSDLQRNERPIRLRPWLYTIARNRCLSVLRARRETPVEIDGAASTAGLAEEVGRRSDLRALLADLRDLPDEQRAALVLSELGDLSHADIAEILGRKEVDVKALVFRARATLADWREARETPCGDIREQLSVLSGGALRRRTLRRHLDQCAGCREFREQVKAQRRMMAVVLPVVPSVGFKSSVLAAAGLGGGAAGSGAAAGGLGAAALAPLTGATVAKIAVIGVIVGGAATAGERAVRSDESERPPALAPAATPPGQPAPAGVGAQDGSSTPASGPTRGRDVRPGREKRRGTAERNGGGASALAPPDTPVRARGNPPALGRVRRGLAPPSNDTKSNNGRAVGRQRKVADAPKVKKEPKPKPEPSPKLKVPRELIPDPKAKEVVP